MKKKRFSVEQIVAVSKQAELGLPVADLIRQVGISEQTFYRWTRQYAERENAPETRAEDVEVARGKQPDRYNGLIGWHGISPGIVY